MFGAECQTFQAVNLHPHLESAASLAAAPLVCFFFWPSEPTWFAFNTDFNNNDASHKLPPPVGALEAASEYSSNVVIKTFRQRFFS